MMRARVVTRALVTAALGAVLAAWGAVSPARAQLVERFGSDPLERSGGIVFFPEGDVAARFEYVMNAPRFPTDRPGALRVLYDTTLPTGRIATPIGRTLASGDDFEFGAILTIRSEGLFADPNGFSQIAFGLWNAHTTGMNRTGFPSDAFDLVGFDYFPNVGQFGGPFLSPGVFGGNVANNAFFNFAFASAEVALPTDVPLLCQFHCIPAQHRMNLRVSRYRDGVTFERIPGAMVSVDLSRLDPGFLVNVAGIAGYFEGYASIRASVDYDLLYLGSLPAPLSVVNRRIPAR